jgi:DNA-binding LytR/AlgR family response regulator
MNALIIEDEREAAERLSNLLRECDPSIRVLQTIDTVQDVVAYFSSGQPADLVFMDIQLADGKSFEIFDQVKIDSPIIFTTAFDQYALQAFKLHSIDYLLKPIQGDDLLNAIQKLKRMYPPAPHLTASDILALKEIIAGAGTRYKQRLLIKAGNKLQYKPTANVCYFFADGKTTYLVAIGDGRKYIIDHTLEELDSMLNPDQFFRISRKYIVNFDCVHEVKGLISSKLEVRLSQPCEHDLSVSRERIHDFKRWMDR